MTNTTAKKLEIKANLKERDIMPLLKIAPQKDILYLF